jgi:hypothetical protein
LRGCVKMLVKGGKLKVEEEKMTRMRYTASCLCGKFESRVKQRKQHLQKGRKFKKDKVGKCKEKCEEQANQCVAIKRRKSEGRQEIQEQHV